MTAPGLSPKLVMSRTKLILKAGLSFVQLGNERAHLVNSSLQSISSNSLVEKNQLVRSNLNVILTRQTCGHRWSKVAGSKGRALAFYFPVRIWYIFFISICREKSDLGVCMTSVLAKRMRLRSADFGFKNVFGRRIRWKLALRSRTL